MRTVLFLLVTVWIPGGILAQPLKTTGVSVGPDGVVQVQGLGRFKMPLPPPPRKLTVGRLRPPGHVLIHVKVLGRGGRAAELVLEVGKGTKPIFVGATGPQGVDGEWSRHLQVSTRGLLLYQRRDGASRCDGKEAYLFPRMFDFGSRSFRPVSMRPAVQGLPVVKASRSARGVPAGEPMNTFQVVFASTHRGDQQQAENLTAPRELEDGDPATSWSESLGGFGQGELLTARSQHTPYRLRAIRILPGDTASKKTFAEANRIKSLVLVLGRGHRLRVQFPRDPLRDRGGFQTPYWIVLPKPIATRCVTLVIHQVHAGRQAGGKRGGGRTAISELRLFTDLEYGGGMEQLVKDLGSQNERRANAAVVVLSRLGVRGIEAVSKGIGKATGKTLNRMLRVLTRSRHPASAAPLAEALPRLDRVRQRLALEALARLGAVAVKPLAALLDLKDLPLRLVARALGSIRHGEVRPALLSRAGSGSEARRAAIVEGLATMRGGADDLEALLDAAASSGAPARRADLIYAVTRLGRRIPAARSAAAARLATIWTGASSEPFELRYRLLAGIGALDPGAHLPLLASASSPRSVKDPVLRWLAVQQLRRVQQPRATVALLLAAGDPSPRIRSTAALALARCKPGKAITVGLTLLAQKDPWAVVARSAATALGSHCSPEAVLALREVVRRGSRGLDVDLSALNSLARCKPNGLGPFLLAMAGDRRWRPEMREQSLVLLPADLARASARELIRLLKKLGRNALRSPADLKVAIAATDSVALVSDKTAANALADITALHPMPALRIAAAMALGKVCHSSTRPTLRRAQKDVEPKVRHAARQSLVKCGWKKGTE